MGPVTSRRSINKALISMPLLTAASAFATKSSASNSPARLKHVDPNNDGPLAQGKFGRALNGAWSGAETKRSDPAFKTPPFTVELWCKLDPLPVPYNFTWCSEVLIANEPIESADHWRIYLEGHPEDGPDAYGCLMAHFRGLTPDTIKSEAKVADGRWHYVAMVRTGNNVSLYLDAKLVAKSEASARISSAQLTPGPLTVAKATLKNGGSLDCNALIDSVRLSNVARAVKEVPKSPFERDGHTIGLWNFNVSENASTAPDDAQGNDLVIRSDTSLDELDRHLFLAGPSPMDAPPIAVALEEGSYELPPTPQPHILDEGWQLCFGDKPDWQHAFPASVPGSIYTALHAAGLIPDPYFAKNQDIAAPWAEKTFWYRTMFSWRSESRQAELTFRGVSNQCSAWLNGEKLGDHEGMFTEFSFRADNLDKNRNELLIKLEPDAGWADSVVLYNSYYYGAKMPPLGIWQPVVVGETQERRIDDLFVATHDAHEGILDIAADIAGASSLGHGKFIGIVSPDNFEGQSYHFVLATDCMPKLRVRLTVPNHRLWWPNGLGESNLYRIKIAFVPDDPLKTIVAETTFGIRTIAMAPVNGVACPRRYNWTFKVNGRPMFVKGANWYTCDALMDFSRERYSTRLDLAKQQHIQFLRCWGCGLVETNDFYDLCDRKGIMVMQEWPTTNTSIKTQPTALLEDVVVQNTKRLRNHPSLVMWCAGNESSGAGNEEFIFDPLVNFMGRVTVELDGTRPFHRAEPYGGADHDYSVLHYQRPIDDAFGNKSVFQGEFGMPSYPNLASVRRFLPKDEVNEWPPPPKGSFAYHTPSCGTEGWEDLPYISKSMEYFTERRTMAEFITDSQLTQSTVLRHMIERSRTNWPHSTGALYMVFNDNAPAASLSTVDWYGAPKLSYFIAQDAFAPLSAVATFSKATSFGEELRAPVAVLDDNEALDGREWLVTAKAYDQHLKCINKQLFDGRGCAGRVKNLGEILLSPDQTKSAPLLFVLDLMGESGLVHRNFYFLNWKLKRACLFDLPKTELRFSIKDGILNIANVGSSPAVGVQIEELDGGGLLPVADNMLWIERGEVLEVPIGNYSSLAVSAWNAVARRV